MLGRGADATTLNDGRFAALPMEGSGVVASPPLPHPTLACSARTAWLLNSIMHRRVDSIWDDYYHGGTTQLSRGEVHTYHTTFLRPMTIQVSERREDFRLVGSTRRRYGNPTYPTRSDGTAVKPTSHERVASIAVTGPMGCRDVARDSDNFPQFCWQDKGG